MPLVEFEEEQNRITYAHMQNVAHIKSSFVQFLIKLGIKDERMANILLIAISIIFIFISGFTLYLSFRTAPAPKLPVNASIIKTPDNDLPRLQYSS